MPDVILTHPALPQSAEALFRYRIVTLVRAKIAAGKRPGKAVTEVLAAPQLPLDRLLQGQS